MNEHFFAMFGVAMMALIALSLIVALGYATADKLGEWRRTHERKWKMECLLDQHSADLAKLEARVTALESKEVIADD